MPFRLTRQFPTRDISCDEKIMCMFVTVLVSNTFGPINVRELVKYTQGPVAVITTVGCETVDACAT